MSNEIFVESVDGTIETLHVDEITGDAYFKRVTDCEPVVEQNKREKSMNADGMGESREWKKVASIPMGFIREYEWLWGIDLMAKENEDILMRILNDPNYRHLRTSEGKV